MHLVLIPVAAFFFLVDIGSSVDKSEKLNDAAKDNLEARKIKDSCAKLEQELGSQIPSHRLVEVLYSLACAITITNESRREIVDSVEARLRGYIYKGRPGTLSNHLCDLFATPPSLESALNDWWRASNETAIHAEIHLEYYLETMLCHIEDTSANPNTLCKIAQVRASLTQLKPAV